MKLHETKLQGSVRLIPSVSCGSSVGNTKGRKAWKCGEEVNNMLL